MLLHKDGGRPPKHVAVNIVCMFYMLLYVQVVGFLVMSVFLLTYCADSQ